MGISISDSADVAENAMIGNGSKVRHLIQARENGFLGTAGTDSLRLPKSTGSWALKMQPTRRGA